MKKLETIIHPNILFNKQNLVQLLDKIGIVCLKTAAGINKQK